MDNIDKVTISFLGLWFGAAALCLYNCRKVHDLPKIYLEGTIAKEIGNGGGCNPYILQIKTSEGIYTANVINNEFVPHNLELLSLTIEEGSKVKFVKRAEGKDRFRENRMGTIYTSELNVLEKK